MQIFNLDVSSPDQLSDVLRRAADAYLESAADLQADWQDGNAGRVWIELARVLNRAADAADKAVSKHFV